jgi:hypothetical protein
MLCSAGYKQTDCVQQASIVCKMQPRNYTFGSQIEQNLQAMCPGGDNTHLQNNQHLVVPPSHILRGLVRNVLDNKEDGTTSLESTMESQDWQDNMSRQAVLRKSENSSTSRVSLSTSVSGSAETPFDIILIKQARPAERTTFIFAFGAKD